MNQIPPVELFFLKMGASLACRQTILTLPLPSGRLFSGNVYDDISAYLAGREAEDAIGCMNSHIRDARQALAQRRQPLAATVDELAEVIGETQHLLGELRAEQLRACRLLGTGT